MKVIDVTGTLEQREADEDSESDYTVELGGLVLFSFGYCGGFFHFLDEFVGRNLRITVELLED